MTPNLEPPTPLEGSGSRADDLEAGIRATLMSVYEEIMWLAARPTISASLARTWYTHARANSLSRRIRRFTGKVSTNAATDETVPLRLEHFKRIQTTLTELVQRHIAAGKLDADEFTRVVLDCEQVHIVTFAENYDAMQAKGNYDDAGIILVDWESIAPERQRSLWKRMLVGRVANAAQFAKHYDAHP
jgi:hypothetical protein